MKELLRGVLLLLATVQISYSISDVDAPRYMSASACEGRELYIVCEDGYLIHLIRANYGRFSISICNDHGNLDWKVDCMSHRSFRVMQQSCDMKRSCRLPASTSYFGDPCPGTLKYLEAHYQCVPETTTTTRKPLIYPPLIMDPSSAHSVPPQKAESMASSSSTTSPSVNVIPKNRPIPSWPPVLMHMTPTTTTTSTSTTTEETSSVSPTPEDLLSNYCQPAYVRDISWNWTRAGTIAIYQCPGGAKGEARWQCGINPVKWMSNRPNLSNCSSLWVGDLERRIYGEDAVVNLASELADKTRVKSLYGGDLLRTTSIVQQLVSKMEHKLDESSDSSRRNLVVEELMNYVIDFSSNLLDDHQQNSWDDLPTMEQRLAASSLLEGLERNADLLLKSQNTEFNYTRAKNNILASVQIVHLHNVQGMYFPNPYTIKDTPWEDMEDSIFLPTQALMENSRKGLVKVAFFSYNKIEEILEADFSMYPTMYGDPNNQGNVTRVINSRVIATSLGRQSIGDLPEPVLVTLRHLREENMSNPQCIFWDFVKRDWSTAGCWVENTNRSHTVCACNHLTNFAVLMDVRATKLSYSNEVALQVITYVGCVVSIICMLLTILTFHFFRGLKSDRTIIHKNLCLCLLIAEVVFVGGIAQTHLRVVCGVVAGLLHYFFLAAFVWMFLEGFQLYVMLIEVFDSEKSRIKWYYCLSYGVPIIIVGVAAVIDPYSYGTERYCWLRADNYFIFSFVGPVVAILLANMVFLSIAIYTMCRHSSLTTTIKSKEQSKLTNIKVWIRGATVLVFLLGLTWAFGLLYLNEESIFMAYMFTILNSLQGLFIFVFHCILNEKVQKEYHKFVRQSRWIPKCMKHEKCQDRRSSFYVHSNGTMTAPPSSGQHSFSNQFWTSPKNQDSTASQSTFLKAATLDRPTAKMLIQGNNCLTLKPNGSLPKQKYKKKVNSSANNGCIDGDLSAADCSVVDSECLSEFCDKMAFGRVHAPNDRQPPPPYGHFTETSDGRTLFVDHIYETIDDEPATPTLYRQYLVGIHPNLEGHIRSHSDASHQSSSSIGCDRRPLIQHSSPNFKGPGHPTSNVNIHPNLIGTPLARTVQLVSLNNSTKPDRLSNSFPQIESTTSQTSPSDHLHSLPNLPNEDKSDSTRPLNHDTSRLHNDNTMVMAVFDGERVVCCLQGNDQKLMPAKQPCHPNVHLSTDC